MCNGLPALLFAVVFLPLVTNAQAFSYEQIEQQIKRGDLNSAATALTDRLRVADTDSEAHLLMGMVLAEKGDLTGALEQFHRAHELRPTDAAPLTNSGKTLAAEGKLDEAAAAFASAIRTAPRDPTAHVDLGMLRLSQHDWAAAIEELRAASYLSPEDPSIWFALCEGNLALHRLDAVQEAVAHIRNDIPAAPQVLARIGALQAAAGDYGGAIITLRRAVGEHPSSSPAAYNLALAWLRRGEPGRAAVFIEGIPDSRNHADLQDLLGEAFEKEGRAIDAVRSFERAATLDPSNEDYCFDYLTELLAHRTFDAAILVGRAAQAHFPHSVKIRLAVAGALYGKRENAQAQQELDEATSLAPDSDWPLYFRSMIAEAGHQADATLTKDAESFVAKYGSDPVGWLVLGRAQLQGGDVDASIASLGRSLALQEGSAEAHFELANAYYSGQDWAKVVHHCQRAIALGTTNPVAWYRLALALRQLGRHEEAELAMQKFKRLQTAGHNGPVQTFLFTLRQEPLSGASAVK